MNLSGKKKSDEETLSLYKDSGFAKKPRSFKLGRKHTIDSETTFTEKSTEGDLTENGENSDKTFIQIDFDMSRNSSEKKDNAIRRKSSSILQLLEKKSVDKSN